MSKRALAKEVMEEQNSDGKREINPLIYQFLPVKDKETGSNKLYLGLYDLSAIPQLKNLKKKSGTWVYCYKVESHYIWDSMRRRAGNYICQNPAKNMFIDSHAKCPFCDVAGKFWELRKDFQGDREYDEVKNEPVFKKLTEKAKSFSAWKKFPYVVLDIEKAQGSKKLSEKEIADGFGMQAVLMPVNADKEIRQFVVDGYEFWELVDENGKISNDDDKNDHVFVVNVKRDNEGGARNAKYSASVLKDPVKLDKDWIACIQEDIPNPFDILFENPTEEEWLDLCERILPDDEEIRACAQLESSSAATTATATPPPAKRKSTPAAETTEPAEESKETEETESSEETEEPTTTSRRRRRKLSFDD